VIILLSLKLTIEAAAPVAQVLHISLLPEGRGMCLRFKQRLQSIRRGSHCLMPPVKNFNSTTSCNYQIVPISTACEVYHRSTSNRSTNGLTLPATVSPVTLPETFYYGPVVDGRFIRELPDQAYKYGRFYNVPLLVDRDAYEGYIFTQPNLTTSQAIETVDAQTLFPFAGQSFFSRLYQLYPASDFNSTLWQRATWFGDFIINCKSPSPSFPVFDIRD
jgi:hypothetical protein